MKEWKKAWAKVDLFDKWKPASARDHWHAKAFKAGWDGAVTEIADMLLNDYGWNSEQEAQEIYKGVTELLDDDPCNLQS